MKLHNFTEMSEQEMMSVLGGNSSLDCHKTSYEKCGSGWCEQITSKKVCKPFSNYVSGMGMLKGCFCLPVSSPYF